MTDNHDNHAQPELQGFEDAPRKLPRWVKYLGGTAVGLVIVAAGAGFVISGAIDQQKYKAIIVEKVETQTGYKVDWNGDIGVSLLPMPHATIQGLTVTANDQAVLKVKSADVSVELWPLLSRKVVVDAVTVDNPEITLVTAKDGQKLWEPKSAPKETADSTSSDNTDTADAPVDVTFNVIEINDGVVVWDDRTSGPVQKIEDFDLRVKAQSLKGPFDINGGMLWNGKKIDAKINAADLDFEKGMFPVKVKLAMPEANVQGDFSGVITTGPKLDIEGDIQLDAESLKDTMKVLSGDASSLPDELAGKLELSSKIKVGADAVSMNDIKLGLSSLSFGGDVDVTGFANKEASPTISAKLTSLKKVDQNAAPLLRLLDDLDLNVKGSMKGEVIQIDQSVLKLNDNDVSASGTVALGGVPKVDMNVAITKFDVDQLSGNLAEAGKSGEKSKAEAKSDSGAAGFDLPFTGRVRADVKKLRSGGKDYTNIKADVAALNGALQISKLEAGLPDGIAVKANGAIGKTNTLSGLDLSVSAEIDNVEQLAKTYNVTLPELPQKIGAATVKADLSGDMSALGFDASVGVWGLTASGKGTVNSPMASPVINKLDFAIKHPNFMKAIQIVAPEFESTAGFEGPLDISGSASWNTANYKVTGLKGIMGKTTVEGGIEADTTSKPSVTGNLAFGSLVLPSSSAASGNASSARAAAPSGGSGKARWSREAIDMSWMKSFNADIAITAKSITQNLWSFTNAKLDFVLKDGTLDIEDMSAGLFGGDAKLSGQVRSGTGERDPLAVKGALKASNVDARKLQSALSGAPSDTIYGTIKAVDINVNATGLSPAALVQTLGGKGTITGENIVVKGVDAAQLGMAAKGSYKPLERAGTMFGSFGDGQTEFTTFDSAFDIQNGIVNLTKSIFDGPKATLSSVGTINVPLWTIDLKNTMTVKDTDIPPFDFTVKGPLDAPTKAGGSVIEDYLRGKVNKKVNKLLEKQLGKLLGAPEQTGGTAPAGTAPATDNGAAITDPSAAAPSGAEAAEPAPAPAPKNNKDAVKQEALKALGNFLGQ